MYPRPRRRSLSSNARRARSNPWSLFHSFVVTKTSFRGTPLSRTATPTSVSFPYSVAVSMSRYPHSKACRTESRVARPAGVCHTPRPSHGISTLSLSVTRDAIVRSIRASETPALHEP